MSENLDQAIQQVKQSFSQIQANPKISRELRKSGVDMAKFSLALERNVSPVSPITPVAYPLVLGPPAAVFSLGVLVAGLMILVISAYVIAHIEDVRQLVLAMISQIQEVAKSRERIKGLRRKPSWRPECESALNKVLSAVGKLITRFNSPAGKSPPTLTFTKGIAGILETDFIPAMEDLMKCLGYGTTTPEYKYLFGQSGLLKIAKKFLEDVLKRGR